MIHGYQHDCGSDGPHAVIYDGPEGTIAYCEACQASFTIPKAGA